MTVRELLKEIILIKTVQSISTKMYCVLFTKIEQGANTASGTALQKKCSKLFG